MEYFYGKINVFVLNIFFFLLKYVYYCDFNYGLK